jgi:GntR family transcriptional regulator/MocR family aminotransferase
MNTNLAYAIDRISIAYQQQVHVYSNKYTALYKAIKVCIQQQELPNNWLIPATRTLAEALQLSRSTVITAYDLLLLEKLISARQGSGYRVTISATSNLAAEETRPTNQFAQYPETSHKGQAFLENIGLLNRSDDHNITFKPGLPPVDVFPINKWKNLLNGYWRYIRASELSYGQSSGTYHLKTQICNYLKVSRSVKVSPEQVVIVSGSLQSIYLVASAVVNAGDTVALENPTFPNVHSIFKGFRAQLLATPLDVEGMDLSALKKSGAKAPPKLIHVTPSNHYPLSIKMSLARRKALLQYASSIGAYLIENDYEHEVGNETSRLPTLFNLDQEQRTIYLGTFNRLLYPSIRLGFMVVPPHLAPVIAALQEHSHRFVAPSIQMVMGQFIERNFLYQHLKNVLTISQNRANVFKQAFEQHHPENLLLLQNEFVSLHMTVIFKVPVNRRLESKILEALSAKGIAVFPLSKCYVSEPLQTGFIIGFSTVRSKRIPEKVKILIRVIQEHLR